MKARIENQKFAGVLIQTVIRFLAVAIIGSQFSCAPLSSDLQSARLVGKRRIEITPGYSTAQFAEEKKPADEKRSQETSGKLIGVQVAYGLSNKVDIRVRVEHFQFREFSANVFSIGPKVSLVKDRVALYLPVWFVDFKPAQLQPTLLVTFPIIKNKIEFNPSVKGIFSVGGYDPSRDSWLPSMAGWGLVRICPNGPFALSTAWSRTSARVPCIGVLA